MHPGISRGRWRRFPRLYRGLGLAELVTAVSLFLRLVTNNGIFVTNLLFLEVLLTNFAIFVNIYDMNIEDYVAGTYVERYQYKCFVPSLVNHEWTWKSAILTSSLERAVRALASLDAFSRFVPDIGLFIRMHVVREANASSRIEGTQTEIEEAVLPESAVLEERRDDWREVNNYVRAMDEAINNLAKLPLSMRLLKDSHQILLSGTRGSNKTPGEIRTSQNWIGGTSISTARFVPPAPEYLPELLSDLEYFWHNDRIYVPNLIRIAISHYQFESIHPFLDGNGRIGRLLIPFFLINCGELALPSLYISSYFEGHRDEYYASLSRVRTEGDLLGWVIFFLNAVECTCQRGCEAFKRIFTFKDKMNAYSAAKAARTGNLMRIFNYLYSHPSATINEISEGASVDYRTANRCVKDLVNDHVLLPANEDKRNRIYSLVEYLELFKQA